MRPLLDPHRRRLMGHFRLDRRFVRGQGAWLWDAEGRCVLDMTSQYGALPLGHNPPELWAALDRFQADAIPALVQPAPSPHAEALAARLSDLAPVDDGVSILAQSGSEAVEIAVRLCREATDRPLVLAAEGGYHGHTLAARALSWRWRDTLDDATRPPGFAHVPFNDVDGLESAFEAHGDQIAALFLEPVQGEGGVWEASAAYLRAARALCTRFGALLVFDEVQTGLGRTGHLFGADLHGVRPDVMLLSKALGGGLVPLAACVATRSKVLASFERGHGSTFAGNGLTCAVGLALLDALTRDDRAWVRHIDGVGARLKADIESIAARWPGSFAAVRGRGGMLGLSLEIAGPESSFTMGHLGRVGAMVPVVASHLLAVCGVRVIPGIGPGATLRLLPPLNIEDAAVDRCLCALEDVARTLHHQDWSRLMRPALGMAVSGPSQSRRHLQRPVRSSPVVESGDRGTRFAFLIHPTCPEDLIQTSPSFADLGDEGLRRLYAWLSVEASDAPVCEMPAIRGVGGALAHGELVSVSMTPEVMLFEGRAGLSKAVQAAARGAIERGAQVVGLGAFTSIVTGNGADADGLDCALTTGSAMTVAAALDGVSMATRALMAPRREGLVLGLGAVGRAAAVLLAEQVPSLVLVGNPAKPEAEARKVEALADRIYARALRLTAPEGFGVSTRLRAATGRWRAEGELALLRRLDAVACGGSSVGLSRAIHAGFARLGQPSPVRLSLNMARALPGAEIVISASSSAGPLLGPELLRSGAIVCDVARPADVSQSVRGARPDVFVFDGGLVRYPDPICFGQNLGLPDGVQLACLTETVLLALEGHTHGRFGVGRGDLIDDVLNIRGAAQRHGMRTEVPGLEQHCAARFARAS